MTTVTIGGRTLAVTRPADLDEQLVSATGCSAEEQASMLRRVPTPFGLARALRPFLAGSDEMSVADLAELIETDEVHLAAEQVAALLAPTIPNPQETTIA